MNIGDTLLLLSQPGEAGPYLHDALQTFADIGTPFGVLWAHYSLGRVALELTDRPRAREHARIASQLAGEVHAAFWTRKTADLLERIDPGVQRPDVPVRTVDNETFSPRELEVLRLLKSDLKGPAIAARLVVSLNTVRYHTKNIFRKLGASSRLEAIRRAEELGL